MCSVIGYQPLNGVVGEEAHRLFANLMRESRIRGMHAYGLAREGFVKRSFSADEIIENFDPMKPNIAHARYSTSGEWRVLENNQPIVVDDFALAFNGVIHMGTKAEYEAWFNVECESDNDGEIFVRKMKAGVSPEEFVSSSLTGSFAGVWLRDGFLYALRNERRPLWLCLWQEAIWFASTKDIFQRAGFEDPTELEPGMLYDMHHQDCLEVQA